MNASRSLPTFLVLGAPRSGTTWLHAVLSHHPQIAVPVNKEPDFFNRRILSEDFSVYLRLIRGPLDQPARAIRGDLSVNYSNLTPPVVREIARLIPDARLIYTLRNPVDRVWSQLKFSYGSFQNRVIQKIPVFQFLRNCEKIRVTRRTDYLWVVNTWKEAFSEQALHVDLYDRIEQDSRGYVRDVLRHIGADSDWKSPEELHEFCIHSTSDHDMPPILRWYLSRQWLESTRRLNDAFEGRMSHWVEAMTADAGRSTLSWRVFRELNRRIITVPKRMAYRAYDLHRSHALVRKLREIQANLGAFDVERGPHVAGTRAFQRPTRASAITPALAD